MIYLFLHSKAIEKNWSKFQWESSAVKYGNTEHGNPGGTIGFKECDQKVLFILQIDKKKSIILQLYSERKYGIVELIMHYYIDQMLCCDVTSKRNGCLPKMFLFMFSHFLQFSMLIRTNCLWLE